MDLKEQVAELRAQDLSQAAIAARVGKSQARVSQILRGVDGNDSRRQRKASSPSSQQSGPAAAVSSLSSQQPGPAEASSLSSQPAIDLDELRAKVSRLEQQNRELEAQRDEALDGLRASRPPEARCTDCRGPLACPSCYQSAQSDYPEPGPDDWDLDYQPG